MGLLDDAIREHLELKRQHGAADDDVARQEAEAFGPARREPSGVHEAPLAAEAMPDVAPEPPPLEEPPPPAEPEVAAPEPVEAPAGGTGDTPEQGFPAVEPEPAEVEPEPAEVEPEPAEVEPEPAGAEEPASDEDVLEETPDFLQETPEHDRLWFEQRPPRDFDFDD
jgi:hypothetical protein